MKGTVGTSSPAIDLNSSAEMNWVLPMLVVPMLNLPGFALAAEMSSATDLYGESELTSSAMPKKPTVDTGAKSFTGS